MQNFVHENHNYTVSVKDWERKLEEGKSQNGVVFKVTGRVTGDTGTAITDEFAAKVAKSADANAKLTNEVESLKAKANGKSAPLPHVAFSLGRRFADRDFKDSNIVMPGEEQNERTEENGGAGTSSTTGTTVTTTKMGLSAASAASIRIIDWDRATRATGEQEEGYVVGTQDPIQHLGGAAMAAKKIPSAADVFSLFVVLAKMVLLPRPIFGVTTFVSAIVVVVIAKGAAGGERRRGVGGRDKFL